MSLLIEQLEADHPPFSPAVPVFGTPEADSEDGGSLGTPPPHPTTPWFPFLNPHFVLLGQELLYTACFVLWPQALMPHPEFSSLYR